MASKKTLKLSPEQFVEKRFDAALSIASSLLFHESYKDEFFQEKARRHFFFDCLKAADIFLKDSGISVMSPEEKTGLIAKGTSELNITRNIMNVSDGKYKK